jgi:riboflavin biosynthesis pyrimidine reductase
MMDLLRAHADAVLCGAGTLRSEALHGPIPRGPVYRIVDGSLLALRQKTFQLPALKIIVVSGSGRLRPADYRLFQSEHVEAWIATTPDGHHRIGDTDYSRVLVSGSGGRVDWEELLHRLRAELFVRHLLCEGGPTLYGDLARAGFVDEKFLTISPQEVGAGLPIDETPSGRMPNADKMLRPTGLAGPGFSVETALWYRWISCRRAGDHEFNRYRRVAPRPR